MLVGECVAAEELAAHGNPGPACGGGDSWLPGLYTLSNVPEVGSRLLLRKDGGFEFYLAYGANDQAGSGCWTQNGPKIALVPHDSTTITTDQTPASQGFSGMLLRIDGRDLVWEIANSGYRGRYTR